MPSSYVIGPHFESFIQQQLAGGRYASASEVVRDALRTLEEREQFRQLKHAALRMEIQKGIESGAAIPASEAIPTLYAQIAQATGVSCAEVEQW